MRAALLIALCFLARHAPAQEPISVGYREELVAALRGAQPGQTILLAPGAYAGSIYVERLQGTKEKPIVVAARDPENPPVIEGGRNGLHLVDPAHVELRGLVFSGALSNGLSIDDGGSFDTPASNIVLASLTIREIGPRGNCDGLKLSGVADFTIENCRISQWGDGGSAIDMVGCRDGRIVRCSFSDARGDGANGVQTKGGSAKIVVQGCRFENAGGRAVNIGGSTGKAYFRPKMQGYEAKEIVVEDCLFIGSAAPAAFVGVDGADFRHNTIYMPTRWIARILQENQDPSLAPSRNGRFENNLVVFESRQLREAINIGPNTAPETFVFRNNAWRCLDRPDDTARLVRLPVAEEGGIYDKPPRFRDASSGDFRLADDSPVKDAGIRSDVGADQ
jgi:hypothetical protein